MVHRVFYEFYFGSIPKGMMVLHHCDVRNCVAAEHLHIGTAKDNMREKTDRKRGNAPKGSSHPNASLSEKDVSEILVLLSYGLTQQEVADQFNISQGHVSSISHRKAWKHVYSDVVN